MAPDRYDALLSDLPQLARLMTELVDRLVKAGWDEAAARQAAVDMVTQVFLVDYETREPWQD